MNSKKIKIKEILPIIILLILVAAVVAVILIRSGDRGRQEPKRQEKAFYGFYDTASGEFALYFNTDCRVYDYSGLSEDGFASVCGKIEKALEKYHKLFDIYREYEGVVNLATINASAGGEAVAVCQELYDFIEYAVSLYNLTGGEMNVTMGAVLSIWHGCREAALSGGQIRVPTYDELSAANAHTGISVIELDEENMTVRLTDPRARIDAGALGKGYATEMIARELMALGVDDFVLNFGGNLRLIGDRGGDGWRVGVQNPNMGVGEPYIKYLNEKNTSVVTSGDYERYYIKDGVKYHHIIDKDTLMPAAYFTSVTVVTENSGLADALSTALFCMSLEDGRALCESLREDGVEVKAVYLDYEGNLTEI